LRDRKFPDDNARNWKEREYNKCGRDAIKKETDRIGKKCRNSGQASKDCNELGEVAADNIVHVMLVYVIGSEQQVTTSRSSVVNVVV